MLRPLQRPAARRRAELELLEEPSVERVVGAKVRAQHARRQHRGHAIEGVREGVSEIQRLPAFALREGQPALVGVRMRLEQTGNPRPVFRPFARHRINPWIVVCSQARRRRRMPHFPLPRRATRRVLRQQRVKHRRAGARDPRDDQRLHDLLPLDAGILPAVLLHSESRRQQLRDLIQRGRTTVGVEPRLLQHLRKNREPVVKRLVAKVGQAADSCLRRFDERGGVEGGSLPGCRRHTRPPLTFPGRWPEKRISP